MSTMEHFDPTQAVDTDAGELLDMDVPGYERLKEILHGAYDQAARGKGAVRHANTKARVDLDWPEQPIFQINRDLGSIDGALYQVKKKVGEVQNLPSYEAKISELRGAIVYAAAAIGLLQEQRVMDRVIKEQHEL